MCEKRNTNKHDDVYEFPKGWHYYKLIIDKDGFYKVKVTTPISSLIHADNFPISMLQLQGQRSRMFKYVMFPSLI